MGRMDLGRKVNELLDSIFIYNFTLCLEKGGLRFELEDYLYYVECIYGLDVCSRFEKYLADVGYTDYDCKLSVEEYKKLFSQFRKESGIDER